MVACRHAELVQHHQLDGRCPCRGGWNDVWLPAGIQPLGLLCNVHTVKKETGSPALRDLCLHTLGILLHANGLRRKHPAAPTCGTESGGLLVKDHVKKSLNILCLWTQLLR